MAEKDQDASRKAALARLKKQGKLFDASKKKEAPKGYTTKEDIIEAFKLKDGKKVTVHAKLTRIGMWDNKAQPAKTIKGNKIPAVAAHSSVAFNFYCLSGPGKGQTPSKILNLVATPKIGKREARSEQDAMDDLVYDLQRCGFDTGKMKSIESLDKMITTYNDKDPDDKVVCSITINAWKTGSGDLNCGVRINRVVDDYAAPEDEDDESEDEDDEEDDEEEEEKPKSKSKAKATSKSKSKKVEEEEEEEEEEDDDETEDEDSSDDEEEDEEDEEESEDAEESDDADEDDAVEYDEDDPSTWIGYKCKCKPEGTKKVATYTIDAFTKRGKKLTVSDTKGNDYTIAADDVTVIDD